MQVFKETCAANYVAFLKVNQHIHLLRFISNPFLPQMTPLNVAENRGHEETVKVLRGAGMSDVSTYVRLHCWQ